MSDYGFVDVYSHAVDQYIWEKLGGNGGMFRFDFSNFVWDDVVSHYEAGRLLVTTDAGVEMYPCLIEILGTDSDFIEFSGMHPATGEVRYAKICRDGTWSAVSYSISLTQGR